VLDNDRGAFPHRRRLVTVSLGYVERPIDGLLAQREFAEHQDDASSVDFRQQPDCDCGLFVQAPAWFKGRLG
jgi:hypothetical protein